MPKKIGRPPLSEEQRRVVMRVTVSPQTYLLLTSLDDLSPGRFIDELVKLVVKNLVKK